jgi:hypothetical protein
MAGDGVSYEPTLYLTNDAGSALLTLSLARAPNWEIEWRHSVTGMTVRDSYTWRQGELVLLESHVPQLDAAGFGDTPGRGTLESDGAGTVIRNLNEPIPGDRLTLRVGSLAHPTTLIHDGRRYELSRFYAGQRVHLEVRP